MSELGKALHRFQQDAPPIQLDGTGNFNNRFASLGGVVAAVRPVLNKHGLVYAQFPTNIDGAPALETMLIHAESGEDIAAVTPLILGKNDPQGYGSALTYARRYALLSILGLVGDEDDDATAAQPVSSQRGDGSGERSSSNSAPGSEDFVQAPRDLEFTFGKKHRGERLSEIPRSYLEWFLTSDGAKQDGNQELRAAVELHLGLADVIAAGAPGAPSDLDDIPFGPSLA